MGVTDSVTPCVGCKEASFDTTAVVLGVIEGVLVQPFQRVQRS